MLCSVYNTCILLNYSFTTKEKHDFSPLVPVLPFVDMDAFEKKGNDYDDDDDDDGDDNRHWLNW